MSDIEYHQTPGPVALATGTQPDSEVVVGVTFQVGGYAIPVSTADIKRMKEKGIDLALPGPMKLGTIEDLTKWVNENLHVSLPAAGDFPPPLDKAFTKLGQLEWTVNQAHLNVPGTEKPNDPKLYTIIISAEWTDEPLWIIENFIGIRGGVVGVTNEPKKSTESA